MNGALPIGGFPPFDRLGAEALRAAERLAARLPLRKGKALFYQGDRADAVHLVLSGSLRSVMYRSDESTLEMGRSGPGDWLGLAELLLASPFLNDTLAEESCEVARFERAGFERLLDMPGLRRFFLLEMARRYYALHSRIELNQPGDRLARFILERCTAPGGEAACTQEEIAEAVGVTRETVNRHLGRLQEEGLVRIGRGSVVLVDRARLLARTLER
jgi:CRP/FNR family transcriptional regulator